MTKFVSFKNKNSSFFPFVSQRLTDVSKMNCLHSSFLLIHRQCSSTSSEPSSSRKLSRIPCHTSLFTPKSHWEHHDHFPVLPKTFLSLSLFLSLYSAILSSSSDQRVITCRWQEETRDLSLSLLLFLVFSLGKRILSVVGWRRKWGEGMESKLSKTVFSSQIYCSKLELLGGKQHGSWDSKLELGSESEPRHLLVQRTSSHHHPSSRLPKTFPFNLFSLNSFFSSSLSTNIPQKVQTRVSCTCRARISRKGKYIGKGERERGRRTKKKNRINSSCISLSLLSLSPLFLFHSLFLFPFKSSPNNSNIPTSLSLSAYSIFGQKSNEKKICFPGLLEYKRRDGLWGGGKRMSYFIQAWRVKSELRIEGVEERGRVRFSRFESGVNKEGLLDPFSCGHSMIQSMSA